MSHNRVIVTTAFRNLFVNLDRPYQPDPNKPAKYKVTAAFPKSGFANIEGVGQVESNMNNILQALDEVCMAQWGFHWNYETAKQYGIGFPPNINDGDMKLAKDAQNNPIPNQVDPMFAGLWTINLTNENPVAVTDPWLNDIAPSTVYMGSWGRAQLEVSAYENNQGSRIIQIKMLNFQMLYNDEQLGGRAPVQTGAQAFGDAAPVQSNMQMGTGQTMGTAPAQPQQMQPQMQQQQMQPQQQQQQVGQPQMQQQQPQQPQQPPQMQQQGQPNQPPQQQVNQPPQQMQPQMQQQQMQPQQQQQQVNQPPQPNVQQPPQQGQPQMQQQQPNYLDPQQQQQ